MNDKEFVAPAPVGILRAAAWPIEALAGFGSASLAKLAIDAGDPSGRSPSEAYLTSWRRTVEQERQLLWRLTADDPRFLKALLFSNPVLFRRVQRYAPRRQAPRSKRMRRLERTLYRYLARAVGRTTPMGLWAGVAIADFADESRQQWTSSRHAVYPDLRPFQNILRDLSRRENYREAASWSLNPTLQGPRDGAWLFRARMPDGRTERRGMDHDSTLEVLIDALADGHRGTFAELSRCVENSTRWRANSAGHGPDTIRALLEALADGGVLVGGLDLPSRFSSAWEALETAQTRLEAPDNLHWATTLGELRATCARMAKNLESASVDEVRRLFADADAEVRALAETLGVSLPRTSDPILHCDLGVPLRVSIDPQQRQRLLETVRAYESCWVDTASPGTMWRHARYAERARNLEQAECLGSSDVDATAPLSWRELETTDDPELRSRLEAWQETLCDETDEVVLSAAGKGSEPQLPASPLGCLYVGLHADFQLVVHGLSDEAATSFARYHDALELTDAVTTWLSQCLERLEANHGIGIVELTGHFERNPNALARPALGRPVIDLWGADRDAVPLAGAEIRLDMRTRLPFLCSPHHERPTAVFWFASANIASVDPVAGQLLETTFHESIGGSFRPLALPVSGELDAPHLSPRARLPCGSVVRPRRTVIDGVRLQKLARLPPWQRYVHWQHLAAEHRWPELLNVSLSGRAPLPMKRSSPLALEALFKGARDCESKDFLVIEEIFASPWLKGVEGEHYAAELALPFARAQHGWSPLSAERAGAQREQNP